MEGLMQNHPLHLMEDQVVQKVDHQDQEVLKVKPVLKKQEAGVKQQVASVNQ